MGEQVKYWQRLKIEVQLLFVLNCQCASDSSVLVFEKYLQSCFCMITRSKVMNKNITQNLKRKGIVKIVVNGQKMMVNVSKSLMNVQNFLMNVYRIIANSEMGTSTMTV